MRVSMPLFFLLYHNDGALTRSDTAAEYLDGLQVQDRIRHQLTRAMKCDLASSQRLDIGRSQAP